MKVVKIMENSTSFLTALEESEGEGGKGGEDAIFPGDLRKSKKAKVLKKGAAIKCVSGLLCAAAAVELNKTKGRKRTWEK